MSGLLVFPSFWGRLWRGEPHWREGARAIGAAIGEAWPRSHAGGASQASFYVDEAWGEARTALTAAAANAIIQLLIDRGVAPEGDDRPGGGGMRLLVFLDRSLRPVDLPPGDFTFQSRRGAAFDARILACPPPGEGFDPPARIRQWAPPTRSRGENTAAAAPPALPALLVTQRTPRFAFDEAELQAFMRGLALPQTLGAESLLRHAARLVQARLAARATAPTPASQAELTEFSAPNPRVTIVERLAAMRHVLGAGHPDVAPVEAMMAPVSEAAIAALRAKHFDDSGYKFVDAVFWTWRKLQLARRLGLDEAAPCSILDIGCGGGHFTLVARSLGHEVVGVDQEQACYADIAAALGVERKVDPIFADTPIRDHGRRFDLVTAILIEFNHLYPRGNPPRYWSLDQWRYLCNDLIARQMRFPGRIYFKLNWEARGGAGARNIELLDFVAARGAKVDRRSGVIDWSLDAPIGV